MSVRFVSFRGGYSDLDDYSNRASLNWIEDEFQNHRKKVFASNE